METAHALDAVWFVLGPVCLTLSGVIAWIMAFHLVRGGWLDKIRYASQPPKKHRHAWGPWALIRVRTEYETTIDMQERTCMDATCKRTHRSGLS